MTQDQAFAKQLADFKTEYTDLLATYGNAWLALVKASSDLERLEIQKKIKMLETQMTQCDQSYKDAERKRIYNALFEMNFSQQMWLFDQYDQQRVAAFLISGREGFGYEWLVQRLLTRLENSGEMFQAKLPLDSNSGDFSSITKLWQQLVEQLKLENGMNEKIAWQAVEQLESHTLVLIVSGLANWNAAQGITIVNEFWDVLVRAASARMNQDERTRLLLFLVDESNCAKMWGLEAINAPEPLVQPKIPIRLQNETPFNLTELMNGLEKLQNADKELFRPFSPPNPPSSFDMAKEQAAQLILQGTQGEPDKVAEFIINERFRYVYTKGMWFKLWA